jgi:hypothetical protein
MVASLAQEPPEGDKIRRSAELAVLGADELMRHYGFDRTEFAEEEAPEVVPGPGPMSGVKVFGGEKD